MSDTQQASSIEASHLAYDVFIFTVETLASAPEVQCDTIGCYNTASELRDNALAGHYLVGSGLFSEQQEGAVLLFLAAVHGVPVNGMPSGAGRASNLAAMQHPAWEPIRALSRNLLTTLASVTALNQAFLSAQSNAS